MLSDAQRAGDFGGTTHSRSAHRPAVPGQSHPGVATERRRRCKLIDQFVPRANSGSNRYVASPDTTTIAIPLGARIDFQLPQQPLAARPLSIHADQRRHPGDHDRGRQHGDGRRSPTTWPRTRGSFPPHAINVARVSYNRIDAHPSVTSGLRNEDFGINVPNTNPLAQGLASIAINGFFTLGDAQQPFVKRVNEVLQFTDDFTLDTRSACAEIRVRCAQGAHAHRVHQPAERRPDVQRRPDRQRRGRFPARPAVAIPQDDDQPGTGWRRLAIRRVCTGRVAARPPADPDAGCATSWRSRSSTATTR